MGNDAQIKIEKKRFRKEIRARRDSLPQKVKEAESASVCRQLAEYLDIHPECRHIYAYYPLGSETDILPFAQSLLDQGYEAAFPRVIRGKSASAKKEAGEKGFLNSEKRAGYSGLAAGCELKSLEGSEAGPGRKSADAGEELSMVFIRVRNLQNDFEEGSYHIMEPVSGEIVDWTDALVLVPGLCFDRHGHRLGYGKGYYDRYFFAHECGALMGICYSCFLLDEIPSEEHDLAMNAVCCGKW